MRELIKSDALVIQNLELMTVIGTLSSEQLLKQKIICDIELPMPVAQAAINDDLNDTIDYDQLVKSISEFINMKRFKLIETLADSLAKFILQHLEIAWVKLKISKPYAIQNCQSVGVYVKRETADLELNVPA